MTATHATAPAVRAAAALFPDLFAVWRPSLCRWQMIRTVRTADGGVVRFRPAWGPWVSASHHIGPTGRPARRSAVFVDGRCVEFNRVGEHFEVHELDGARGMTMRRVPVLDFVCWRSLPRTGV